MADEELHETDEQSAANVSDATTSNDGTNDDGYDIPMDEVEAVLNATADKSTLTPQMQRMMKRQAENTKRVEESIKSAKSNPGWFVPVFCALMIIGLIWAVVFYLTNYTYPIPAIGSWNLLVAFGFMLAGFIMMVWWR